MDSTAREVFNNQLAIAKWLCSFGSGALKELAHYVIDNLITKISIQIGLETNKNLIYKPPKSGKPLKTKYFPDLLKDILFTQYPLLQPKYQSDLSNQHSERNFFQHHEDNIKYLIRPENVDAYIKTAENLMKDLGIFEERQFNAIGVAKANPPARVPRSLEDAEIQILANIEHYNPVSIIKDLTPFTNEVNARDLAKWAFITLFPQANSAGRELIKFLNTKYPSLEIAEEIMDATIIIGDRDTEMHLKELSRASAIGESLLQMILVDCGPDIWKLDLLVATNVIIEIINHNPNPQKLWDLVHQSRSSFQNRADFLYRIFQNVQKRCQDLNIPRPPSPLYINGWMTLKQFAEKYNESSSTIYDSASIFSELGQMGMNRGEFEDALTYLDQNGLIEGDFDLRGGFMGKISAGGIAAVGSNQIPII